MLRTSDRTLNACVCCSDATRWRRVLKLRLTEGRQKKIGYTIEKNAAKEDEKFVERWRNWQCLVVVCVVERNWQRAGGRERLVRLCAVPVSMLFVSSVPQNHDIHLFSLAVCALSIIQKDRYIIRVWVPNCLASPGVCGAKSHQWKRDARKNNQINSI